MESQTRTAYNENAGDESGNLIEEVLRRDNMMRAAERVKANKGAAGVDGIEVNELMEYCRTHWSAMSASSNAGPWAASRLPAMHVAYSNRTMKGMGLKSLFEEHLRFASAS